MTFLSDDGINFTRRKMLRFLVCKKIGSFYSVKGCGEIERTAEVSCVFLMHHDLFILLESKKKLMRLRKWRQDLYSISVRH